MCIVCFIYMKASTTSEGGSNCEWKEKKEYTNNKILLRLAAYMLVDLISISSSLEARSFFLSTSLFVVSAVGILQMKQAYHVSSSIMKAAESRLNHPHITSFVT